MAKGSALPAEAEETQDSESPVDIDIIDALIKQAGLSGQLAMKKIRSALLGSGKQDKSKKQRVVKEHDDDLQDDEQPNSRQRPKSIRREWKEDRLLQNPTAAEKKVGPVPHAGTESGWYGVTRVWNASGRCVGQSRLRCKGSCVTLGYCNWDDSEVCAHVAFD